MDFHLSSTSNLPWIWVVETLAYTDQVDTSLLLDLLEKIPEISDDLGRNAREAVFLRILEQFFVQGTPANPVSNAFSDIIKVDLSESCEDVLQRIMAQASPPCLKLADLEIPKWDLQPFIQHKRSSLPKSTLQQLNDAILTGKNTFLASLIEQSGLSAGNQHEVIMNGGKCNGIMPRLVGSTTGNPLLQVNVPSENLPSINRKRTNSENLEGASCENHIIDNNGSVKKHKHDVICSEQFVGGKLISSFAKEQAAEASAVCTEHDKGERCNMGKINCVGDIGINATPKDDNDEGISPKQLMDCDEVLCPEKEQGQEYDIKEVKGDKKGLHDLRRTNEDIDSNIKRNNLNTVEETHVEVTVQCGCSSDRNKDCTSLKGFAGYNKVLFHEEQAPCSDDEMPNDKFDVEQMQDHNVDLDNLEQNVPENVPNFAEAKDANILSDRDWFLDEQTSIERKKKAFLSSQSTYSQDSLATTDLGELNLCMKCSKGGKLMVCSSDSCPLVIHLNCLGSDASYDTNGRFYCPFCAYSKSISMYMETKKKASLARKNLATFICLGSQNELKGHSCRSLRTKQTDEKPDDDLPRSNKVKRDAEEKVSNHQPPMVLENEQTGLSQLQSGHNLPLMGEATATASTTRVACGSDKDKPEGKTSAEESLRLPEEQQTDELSMHKSLEEKTTCRVSERNDACEKHVDIRSKKETPCPPEADLSHEQRHSSSSQTVDSGESSDEEYKSETSGVSKYFVRVRKPKTYCSYPAIPHLRRSVLPWTTAEENVLKEGIRLYSNPDNKIMPWTRILDHGAGILDKSRTTMDLKDKWRNICKAAMKS